MILVHFSKNEEIKAASIQKPNVMPRVMEVLSTTYKPDMAERYAKAVADFLVAEMDFPEDGIYRIDNEDELCRFNLDEKKWEENGKKKSKYIIRPTSSFWKKFDKEFQYLVNFRSDIVKVVKSVTEKMFDILPVSCRFINVEANHFYTDKAGSYALEEVFSEYCTDEGTNALTKELLQSVFGTDEYPLFIIIDNVPKIAFTKSNIFTEVNTDAIDEFLNRHFSPEDIENIAFRVKNSVMFGRDYKYQIDSLTSSGDIFYRLAGLQLMKEHKIIGEIFQNDYFLNNEQNCKILKNKPIKKYGGKDFYEVCERDEKLYIELLTDEEDISKEKDRLIEILLFEETHFVKFT